jgi:DNA-binding response OmpR family regulator
MGAALRQVKRAARTIELTTLEFDLLEQVVVSSGSSPTRRSAT